MSASPALASSLPATPLLASRPPPKQPRLTRRTLRSALWQLAFAALLIAIAAFAWSNITANLARSGITIDFGFLSREAGFDVSEQLIAYTPKDSYARVLTVGFLNTLLLAVLSLIGATVIGLAIGIGLTSRNWLLRLLSRLYVELLRNLPKLLILLTIYVAMVRGLPIVKAAWHIPGGGFLSNRGLYLPVPAIANGGWILLAALGLWLVGTLLWSRAVTRRQNETGERRPVLLPAIAALAAFLGGTIALGMVQLDWHSPELKGFNIVGGAHLTVQFTALFACLSIYHASQIGEIVRGGIVSVSTGQREAARALGLRPIRILWLIVLPQALRVIIPPLGNQYLNLIKNTSIALAVGYSDLVGVMNTAVNQTFRPVELMAVVMLTFLAINLLTAALLNGFGAATRLPGR